MRKKKKSRRIGCQSSYSTVLGEPCRNRKDSTMGELGGRRISDMTGKYCRLKLNIVERIDPACYGYGIMNFVQLELVELMV